MSDSSQIKARRAFDIPVNSAHIAAPALLLNARRQWLYEDGSDFVCELSLDSPFPANAVKESNGDIAIAMDAEMIDKNKWDEQQVQQLASVTVGAMSGPSGIQVCRFLLCFSGNSEL
jgi:hypothetical protein